ncbi:hypothetical protein Tco_0599626 [Tanacetum coccineum]
MDTAYGRRCICRIGKCEYAFSCDDLALIRRISFPGYGVLILVVLLLVIDVHVRYGYSSVGRFDVFFCNQLLVFQQHQDESLYDSWTRFKDIIRKVPNHGLSIWTLIEILLKHLDSLSRHIINLTAEGDLRNFSDIRAWEVPSFDGSEPQPLLNSPSLDVSLRDIIGPKPPIKPHSLDSSRMKVVDNITTQTPPSPHVTNSHPKSVYSYYNPGIGDPKKHYGFKPGLLGQGRSLGVELLNWEVIESNFLEGLNLPIMPKELEKVIFDEKNLRSS